MLVAAHIQQTASSMDTLATAYQALVHSALQRFSTSFAIQLDADTLVTFVKSVSDALPSTSTAGSERPHELMRFGELLVDLIWAIDSELDEVITDVKGFIANDKKAQEEGVQRSGEKVQAAESGQKIAETDKGTLALVIRKLVVRIFVCQLMLFWLTFSSELQHN